jgi:putative endonuclease
MREDFHPDVYLLASARNGTLYASVTCNLIARIHQHRSGAALELLAPFADATES